MKLIPLTQGQCAKVDDADFDALNQYKWQASKDVHTYYAIRTDRTTGKKVKISMHRVLLSIPKSMFADHKDGDGLNNQRNNLRLATRAENNRNSRVRSDNKLGFKGVYFRKDVGKFKAQLRCNKKSFGLGYYDTADQAAMAYNEAATKYFGEFARLNIIA